MVAALDPIQAKSQVPQGPDAFPAIHRWEVRHLPHPDKPL